MWNKKINAALKSAVLILSILFLPQIVHAETQQSKIILKPKTPGPGDIMVVTIKNSPEPVQGTFRNKPVYFNKTKDAWKAIVGIDLLTEPGTYPLSLEINGKHMASTVRVVKKKYPLERLTLPEDMVVLSPENEARRTTSAGVL